MFAHLPTTRPARFGHALLAAYRRGLRTRATPSSASAR